MHITLESVWVNYHDYARCEQFKNIFYAYRVRWYHFANTTLSSLVGDCERKKLILTLQSCSLTLLRNDRKCRQLTLGCQRPCCKPCFGKNVFFYGYSLNFIIKALGINWCPIFLCLFRNSGPFRRQSCCSREPVGFEKYYLRKNWIMPVLLLSSFGLFWIINKFCTADIIKCLFVESPWLPGPNLADRPSVIYSTWWF